MWHCVAMVVVGCVALRCYGGGGMCGIALLWWWWNVWHRVAMVGCVALRCFIGPTDNSLKPIKIQPFMILLLSMMMS